MRVISGSLKGRNIKGFNILGTRPTMDRVKESIFGMIQNNIFDSTVLDLFSGSGNYGIECISNGAKIVYFNDLNIKCVNVIKENLATMNVLNRAKVTNMDYKKALDYYKKEKIRFDLVFLDPPYQMNVINEILEYLEKKELLNKNGLVICEFTFKEEYLSKDLVLFKEKKYGDKQVFIYKCDN